MLSRPTTEQILLDCRDELLRTVAPAVPEPITAPSSDAVTVPSGVAPVPLTVMTCPGSGVSSDTCAEQPPYPS